MNRVRIVHPQEALTRWADFVPCFENIEEYSLGDYSAELMRRAVLSGKKMLVAFEQNDKLLGACVITRHADFCFVDHIGPSEPVTPERYEKVREALEQYNGGNGENIPPFFEEFRSLMMHLSAKRVIARTRPSMARLWAKLGVRMLYSVGEFKLDR